jgi:uncharacterized repeat protein (TIGR01451 family)
VRAGSWAKIAERSKMRYAMVAALSLALISPWSGVAGAAPGLDVGSDASLQMTHSLRVDAPDPHFGFSSVLNQAVATSVSKFITLLGNVPLPPNTAFADAIQGQIVTFTVNVTNTTGNSVTLTDFLSPNMQIVGLPEATTLPAGVTCAPGGNIGALPTNPPVNPNASRFTCTFSPQADGAGGVNLVFTASVVAGDPFANTACIYRQGAGATTPPFQCQSVAINAPQAVFPPLIPAAAPGPQFAIPAAPRPPLQFIPGAPAPLLPPPGPVPGLQGAPPSGFAEVPVIPEADTVALLVGGLVVLGAFAVLRRRLRDD